MIPSKGGQALADLNEPRKVILTTGNGQTAKLGFSVRANLFSGIHRRALPLVMGMANGHPGGENPVVGGDGDLFAEAGNHFIRALRRNPDVTVLAWLCRQAKPYQSWLNQMPFAANLLIATAF